MRQSACGQRQVRGGSRDGASASSDQRFRQALQALLRITHRCHLRVHGLHYVRSSMTGDCGRQRALSAFGLAEILRTLGRRAQSQRAGRRFVANSAASDVDQLTDAVAVGG